MTVDTLIKKQITFNGHNQITVELYEHPLSLPKHDENAKLISLQGNKKLLVLLQHERIF